MKYEADDRDRRRERAYERLGTRTPLCGVSGCDETDPEALTGSFPATLCYEHAAEQEGRPWTEGDHLAGQHNDPTEILDLPGNDHRVKSGRMSAWPERTLRNPDKSPLIRAAAAIRGWLDVLWIIMMRGVGWIPPLLERLDEWLRRTHGEKWWKDPDLGWESLI